MEAFTRLSSAVVPLLLDNVNTDAIIPASYMRTLSDDSGNGLFARWRYRPDGSEEPSFVLNQAIFRGARILLSGTNFGCGSSRENAVWALQQYGFRCVIALSYGDIFYENSFKNGLLPIVLEPPEHRELARLASAEAGVLQVTVDLAEKRIEQPGHDSISFKISERKRAMLLSGMDDISEILSRSNDIERFRHAHRQSMPWLYEVEKT